MFHYFASLRVRQWESKRSNWLHPAAINLLKWTALTGSWPHHSFIFFLVRQQLLRSHTIMLRQTKQTTANVMDMMKPCHISKMLRSRGQTTFLMAITWTLAAGPKLKIMSAIRHPSYLIFIYILYLGGIHQRTEHEDQCKGTEITQEKKKKKTTKPKETSAVREYSGFKVNEQPHQCRQAGIPNVFLSKQQTVIASWGVLGNKVLSLPKVSEQTTRN